MRDIRPVQRKPDQHERDIPPDIAELSAKPLYEATDNRPRIQPTTVPTNSASDASRSYGDRQALPRRKHFTGSAVPVTNIHIPQEQLSHNDADHSPETLKQEPPRPLFASSPRAKSSYVRVGLRERRILLGFFALAITAAGIAAYIFLPTANIQLILRTAPLLVDQRLTIRSPATGEQVVPGTAFAREIQIEGTSPAAHKEIIGNKARGVARIVNRTFEEQKIKEQSRLLTKDGLLFYMLKHAIVPPAHEGSPSIVEVPVEAAEAGEEGNIEPQRLDFAALDSSSRTLVYAETTELLTEGSGEEVTVVDENDLTQARAAAQGMALQQAEAAVREELAEGWTILEESWEAETVSFETDAVSGDRAPTITYQARIRVRVMGYEQTQLETTLKTALEKQLDKEFMLFPGPISYTTTVKSIDWDKAEVDSAVRITHTTIPRLSLDTLRAKLAGRTRQEAREYLEGLPGVQMATITLWPFWVHSLPRIERRIVLDLAPERQP